MDTVNIIHIQCSSTLKCLIESPQVALLDCKFDLFRYSIVLCQFSKFLASGLHVICVLILYPLFLQSPNYFTQLTAVALFYCFFEIFDELPLLQELRKAVFSQFILGCS